mgnify:CR=1 FL=1
MKEAQVVAFMDTLSNVDWQELADQKALLVELNSMLISSPEYRDALTSVIELLDRLHDAAETAGLWETPEDESED